VCNTLPIYRKYCLEIEGRKKRYVVIVRSKFSFCTRQSDDSKGRVIDIVNLI
jgi:hypothetical protein